MVVAYLYLAVAIISDIAANVLLKASDNLRHKRYAVPAIALAIGAFFCLMQAINQLDLSIAYALWGGIGLLATTFFDMAFFKARLGRLSWLGLFLICLGVGILL